jgi:carbonic anhydrase/acetyltransferase-like protein (isoleucine patch superfamily)
MDVRAIVIIDGAAGSVSGVPLSFFPVLGRPVARQVVEDLFRGGCDRVSVIHTRPVPAELATDLRDGRSAWKQVAEDRLWKSAEDEFSEFAQEGAELVIVYQLGPYVELDCEGLVQKHLDGPQRVTRARAGEERLPIFVLSASRRNDAAALFRSQLERSRQSIATEAAAKYVNELANSGSLRQLALDSFSGKTSFRPQGKEIRPGVWVGPAARVHKSARLVAPCYIGGGSRIAASALITRGSSVEHHSEIDCGTAVENSTVLPCSYVGPGLDLAHSLLRFDSITNLKRDVHVKLDDASIARALPQMAGTRTLRHAFSLLSYLPQQIMRGLLPRQQNSPDLVDSTTLATQRIPAAQQSKVSAEANSDLVTSGYTLMRRYGNE